MLAVKRGGRVLLAIGAVEAKLEAAIVDDIRAAVADRAA